MASGHAELESRRLRAQLQAMERLVADKLLVTSVRLTSMESLEAMGACRSPES